MLDNKKSYQFVSLVESSDQWQYGANGSTTVSKLLMGLITVSVLILYLYSLLQCPLFDAILDLESEPALNQIKDMKLSLD